MSEPGFASLGPSLLARKGGAKPAMRPQVAPLVADEAVVAALPEEQLEDLGWNDMGDGEPSGAEIVPIHGDVAPASDPAGPIVRRQQRRLEERVLADAAMTGPEDREPEYDEEEDEGFTAGEADESLHAPLAPAVPATKARARVPAAQSGRRAAFTLRLDADRHLKLRLAATMHGVSAQVLVTEALDRLLAEYDELEVIANHLKRH
ncbi:hypothetical protein ACLBKU_12290 [Erythrobacter sp. NE805]|uniref:hypothetical protein n=1 Tax=Erythrobacter sp. NE805 TaxID=3389875 RepID=UPI00396B1769